MLKRLLASTALFFAASAALLADEPLKVTKVTDSVYAIVGPIDDRTYENDGLNNNQAFIVTRDGVILIDSGASSKGAERIEKTIASITKAPVKWVINTGSQDHRWLGNGYFAAKGAEVITFEGTVATQKKVAAGQMEPLSKTLKDRFEGRGCKNNCVTGYLRLTRRRRTSDQYPEEDRCPARRAPERLPHSARHTGRAWLVEATDQADGRKGP